MDQCNNDEDITQLQKRNTLKDNLPLFLSVVESSTLTTTIIKLVMID